MDKLSREVRVLEQDLKFMQVWIELLFQFTVNYSFCILDKHGHFRTECCTITDGNKSAELRKFLCIGILVGP